jgi:hypothetical protein
MPNKLHLSAGADEWMDMIVGMETMNTTISERNYLDLVYSYQLYENSGHLSVVGPAITEGLQYIFS